MAPVLESDRLQYRALTTAHLSMQYVLWLNDVDVYKYMQTGGGYTLEMLKEYLKKVELDRNLLFWAIHLKETGKHIGNIKIDPVFRVHGLGEYGIMIGDKAQWGKGYAREATERVLSYCFETEKLRKITLGVAKRNIPAVELYRRIGFEVEGNYRKHVCYHGEYLDVLRMAIFNPAFKWENE